MTSHDSPTEADSFVLRRRAILAGIGGTCLTAGCSGGETTATPNPLERGARTEEEHAVFLTVLTLTGVGPWVTGIRTVTTEPTDDDFRLVAEFDLDRRRIGSPEQQAESTDSTFRQTAVPVLEELDQTSGFERLTEVVLQGYVPTEADVERTDDGHAVAVELTMSMETIRSIEWDGYDRSRLSEDASSYEVHEDVFTNT